MLNLMLAQDYPSQRGVARARTLAFSLVLRHKKPKPDDAAEMFFLMSRTQVRQINKLQEHINSAPTPAPLITRKKTLTPRYFIYRKAIMSYIPENDIRAEARHLRKAR